METIEWFFRWSGPGAATSSGCIPEVSHPKMHEVVNPIGCLKLIQEFGSACEVEEEVGGRNPVSFMNGEVPTDP